MPAIPLDASGHRDVYFPIRYRRNRSGAGRLGELLPLQKQRYNRAYELKMNEGRCDKCFPKTCHRGWL